MRVCTRLIKWNVKMTQWLTQKLLPSYKILWPRVLWPKASCWRNIFSVENSTLHCVLHCDCMSHRGIEFFINPYYSDVILKIVLATYVHLKKSEKKSGYFFGFFSGYFFHFYYIKKIWTFLGFFSGFFSGQKYPKKNL